MYIVLFRVSNNCLIQLFYVIYITYYHLFKINSVLMDYMRHIFQFLTIISIKGAIYLHRARESENDDCKEFIRFIIDSMKNKEI